MCASVIADVDARAIPELSKYVLNFMALPVEAAVICNFDFAVGFRGNARLNSTVSKGSAEPSTSYPLSPRSSLASGAADGINGVPLTSVI